jgi:hypothetical protein
VDEGTLLTRWKQLYGAVYEVKVLDQLYFIRPLTENEFKILWGGAFSFEVEDRDIDSVLATIETALLQPSSLITLLEESPNNYRGGIPQALCTAILQISNYNDIDKIKSLLEENRELVQNSTLEVLKDYIITAEIGYTLKDLEDSTIDQICRLTAHAEQVTIFKQIQRQKANSGDEPHTIEFLTKSEITKRTLERQMADMTPMVEQIANNSMRR